MKDRYKIVLTEHQNYYPDISFLKSGDEETKFAVDIKTTYRNPDNPFLCNGFTLLGQAWFDDYWMNYKKITISDGKGGTKKITTLKDFVAYRKGDVSLIIPKRNFPSKKDRE